jgi:quercetin 2,3-dioxygenase
MVLQNEAKIYLAGQRGCSQAEHHRSLHVFNFGNFQQPHKYAIHNLEVLNDDTLKGSSSTIYTTGSDCLTLLLPLVGACAYADTTGMRMTVDAGQCYIGQGSRTLELTNPYEDELINYVYLQLKAKPQDETRHWIVDFDLDASRNKLVHLFEEPLISIGRFDGRATGSYVPRDPAKGVFVFVLEGAFEVQDRLLQPRDGLALWNVADIEFEALSNEAIVMLIDQHL